MAAWNRTAFITSILSSVVLTGCGPEFNNASSDLAACLVDGEWTEVPNRRMDLTSGRLNYYSDGTYRMERQYFSTLGETDVAILTGDWELLDDGALQVTPMYSARATGEDYDEALEMAEALLAIDEPSTNPAILAATTHCDQEYMKFGAPVKVSENPLVYHGVLYEEYENGAPGVKYSQTFTESENKIVTRVRSAEYFNHLAADNAYWETIKTYTYRVESNLKSTDVVLTDCTGMEGCTNPTYMNDSHAYYDTAISWGSRFHGDQRIWDDLYFYR